MGGEEALEAADRLPRCLALAHAPLDVGDRPCLPRLRLPRPQRAVDAGAVCCTCGARDQSNQYVARLLTVFCLHANRYNAEGGGNRQDERLQGSREAARHARRRVHRREGSRDGARCRDATGSRYGRRSQSCSADSRPTSVIARAYRDYDYRLRELAGALGCHTATASRRRRIFEERRMS